MFANLFRGEYCWNHQMVQPKQMSGEQGAKKTRGNLPGDTMGTNLLFASVRK